MLPVRVGLWRAASGFRISYLYVGTMKDLQLKPFPVLEAMKNKEIVSQSEHFRQSITV
jgi:hypothetical protein